MSKQNKFYITTPIYYVNDKPHIGHAYTTVAADVLARYHRMLGNDVFFLTGTDEHGLKIKRSAEKAGKTPIEWCNENSAKFKLVWDSLNISYDNFIRTTDPSHIEAVKKAIKILSKKNLIYRGKYEGLYCVDCERYYTSKELVNGKCPIHQKEPIKLVEDCYFTDKHGDNDDVDLWGESTPSPLIKDNLFINPAHDDMINPTKCSAIIIGNIITGADDHGIVLRDKGTPLVMNNIIYNCSSAGRSCLLS